MEKKLYQSPDSHGGGDGVPTPVPCGSEGQGGSRSDDMMALALEDSLRQCMLMGDFDKALSRWFSMERMALMMGASPNLVLEYGTRLIEHFEKAKNPLVRLDVNTPGNTIIGQQTNNDNKK